MAGALFRFRPATKTHHIMALTAGQQTLVLNRAEKYLDKASVYEQALGNRNYEGNVKQNATLSIVSVGDISLYTDVTWTDSDWDDLATTAITFQADQTAVARFRVQDTDQAKNRVQLLKQGGARLAVAWAREVDDYVATLHSSITTNVVGSDGTPTVIGFDSTAGETLPTDALAQLYQAMAESDADMSGPNVVVPVWFGGYLLQELGIRNTGVGDQAVNMGATPGAPLPVPAGGFKQVWVSNNVANTASAKYKVMAGTPQSAITIARQIDKLESLRLQNAFADAVKALLVYGGAVPYEQHMGLGTFNKGTSKS